MNNHIVGNKDDRSQNNKMKIDIGCGSLKKNGYIGVDIVPALNVDYVLDITKKALPFSDASVDEVFSSHCFEHLEEHHFILQEIVRVCRDGAHVEIWIPYQKNSEAYLGGHKSYWSENTWKHICIQFDDIHQKDFHGRLVLQRFKYILYPGIEDRLLSLDIPIAFAIDHLFNIVFEMCAEMVVVKNIQKAAIMKVDEPPKFVSYARFGQFNQVKKLDTKFASVFNILKNPTDFQKIALTLGSHLPLRFRNMAKPLYHRLFRQE
jgi:SAM-dependent methyltransferase